MKEFDIESSKIRKDLELMETPRQTKRQRHLDNISTFSTPLHIPASPFMKNLGYGTGVNVYRLERSPKCGQIRSPWAVKRVSQKSRINGREEFNARLQEEAAILRKLSHPNIVGFRGVAKAEDGVESLALECCSTSLGSLLEERHEQNLGALPAKNILKVAVDISQALDYLHTEARILHGDIKSYNILIKNEFEICKLCDFGVSLPLDENGFVNLNKHSNYNGTDLWSAPEVINEDETIDSKADIFSFGLVIYETIALVPPHTLSLTDENEFVNGGEKGKDKEDYTSSMDNSSFSNENSSFFDESSSMQDIEFACGTRPPLPQAFELKDEYNCIVELFYCCTNELPEDRPTAKAVYQSLQEIEKQM